MVNSGAAKRRITVFLAIAVSAIVGTPVSASVGARALPRDHSQTYITVDVATGSVISVANRRPSIDYARSYRGDAFPVFGWWETHIS